MNAKMSATFPSFADISAKFSESTLDEIIRNVGGTRHTSYKFGPSGKKGDAYLSRVFRITIYGVKEDKGRRRRWRSV